MTIRRAKIIHSFAFIMMVSFGFASQAETLEISASKELLWDQSQGVYKAIGDAKAVRGVQSISADLLQAYYNDQSEDQDIERIIATTNVRFADADLKGQGTELDYDISRDFYELSGPKAFITSKDGTARADKILSFDRQNGLIKATENSKITLSDGRHLEGDMIEITLTETEEIKAVLASGQVYVRQEDGKEAFADEANYDALSGLAILTGNVKIIDGESILNGQKAEIDFNKGISRLLADEGSGRVSGTLVTSN